MIDFPPFAITFFIQTANSSNQTMKTLPPALPMVLLALSSCCILKPLYAFQFLSSRAITSRRGSSLVNFPRCINHNKDDHDHNTRCTSRCGWPSSSQLFMSTSSASSSSSAIATQIHSSYDNNNRRRPRIGIIGGGASGMFSATAAADAVQRYIQDNHGNDGTSTSLIAENGCDVIVFEGTSKTMSKVRISGGGRCNGTYYYYYYYFDVEA